jgi:hypothetical protein
LRDGIEKIGANLLIKSLKTTDSGIYQCMRKGGKFDQIKLNVFDPSKLFIQTLAYLKSEEIFLKKNELSYQVLILF